MQVHILQVSERLHMLEMQTNSQIQMNKTLVTLQYGPLVNYVVPVFAQAFIFAFCIRFTCITLHCNTIVVLPVGSIHVGNTLV